MSAAVAPWLSILVPVYNVQDYLEECLTSVVEQLPQLQQSPNGVAGVEILVLDDRSTDGSRALMDQLAQRWPGRLTLMHHAVNQGLSAARNTMIDAARGDRLQHFARGDGDGDSGCGIGRGIDGCLLDRGLRRLDRLIDGSLGVLRGF